MTKMTLTALIAGLAGASAAFGAITITNSAVVPTYGTTLTFDEPGGPTGVNLPSDSWTSYGISAMYSGEGANAVSQVNTNPGFSWLGTGNVFYGPFGVFIEFDSNLTEFSAEFWDSSGPSSGFGGGAAVVALQDGVKMDFLFLNNPAYGGAGNTGINIVATEGMTFNAVTLLGFGFFPESYVDNLSWNKVPAPGAASLAALGLMAAGRRRRN